MPRVKRGTIHVKKRKTLMAKVKGFMWGRKNRIRLAKTASVKAGVHAYRDRRLKKRTNRGLWQIKIGAFARTQDLSYSRMIDQLKKADVAIDRKILADLAVNHKEVLAKIVAETKQVK